MEKRIEFLFYFSKQLKSNKIQLDSIEFRKHNLFFLTNLSNLGKNQ